MEGPSLFLAQQQLRPFRKQVVRTVSGNTKIGKERLLGLLVKDIFAHGKHLVFQFDSFAMRIHFMLFGSFEAEVGGVWVTGDYRRGRVPRLAMTFNNGVINTYSCSIRFIESASAKRGYDFSIDIMSKRFDPALALKRMRAQPESEISDVLLDQTVFAGVGNIIKNEVLSLTGIAPQRKIADLKPRQLKAVIAEAQAFSKQFYRWRRKFVLTKNLRAHRRSLCPHCGGRQIREKTGTRQRWAYWCPLCQH